jgi:acyl-CoA thioester hydrolase
MRWADMDLQGHVNNVVYVDYLQEARVDMLRVHAKREATGELAEALVVVRHEVHYRAPLTYDFKPVSIECWVTDMRAASFTMAYEVFHDDPAQPDGRRVYHRATTVLTPFIFESERPRRLSDGERSALTTYLEESPPWADPARLGGESRRDKVGHYPVHVRFSDVDVYGHVNNVKYFEYYQEARIAFLQSIGVDLLDPGTTERQVVARIDVDYRRPLLFRPEPYVVQTWVDRVGTSSYDLGCRIVDGPAAGDEVYSHAEVRLVAFDLATSRSRPLGEIERSSLSRALSEAGPPSRR